MADGIQLGVEGVDLIEVIPMCYEILKKIKQYTSDTSIYYASWLNVSIRRPDDDPTEVETRSQLA